MVSYELFELYLYHEGNMAVFQFKFIIIFNVGGEYLGHFCLSQFQSINGLAVKIPHCELVAWEHAIELMYHFGIW